MGEVAQAVEVSAFPERYQNYQPVAEAILAALTVPAPSGTGGGTGSVPETSRILFPLPEGTWTKTSDWGYRSDPFTGETTYHAGTDYAAADGTLFFGAINKLETLLDPAERHPEVVILELNHLVSLDTTGLEGLESLSKSLHKRGCALLLCNLNPQPESLITRSGFVDEIGPNNICGDIYGALARARDLLPKFIDEDNL